MSKLSYESGKMIESMWMAIKEGEETFNKCGKQFRVAMHTDVPVSQTRGFGMIMDRRIVDIMLKLVKGVDNDARGAF